MLKKLRQTTGAVTRREVLLTLLVAVMALFFVFEGMHYLDAQQRKGDDALRANTADSVARINSNNGLNCPVKDCHGTDGSCVHYTDEGYVGFFDDVGNTIIGERPAGYNAHTTMTIGDNTWHGARGTMVIRVVVRDGDVMLNWESGK